MEPVSKKARLLTDHFRVALKPRDLNVPIKSSLSSLKKPTQVEVVTISDDEEDDNNAKPRSKLLEVISTANIKTVAKLLNNNNNNSYLFKDNNNLQNLHQHHKQQHHQQHNNQNNQKQLKQHVLENHQSNKQQQLLNPNKYFAPPGKNPHLFDHDRSQLHNIIWEPHYAWDSFEYDRQQELKFKTSRYLDEEDEVVRDIIAQNRAELTDWLVEIQMRFSLDHEALYMATKLADQYLMKQPNITTEFDYQLLFVTCVLISAKFDERVPPITVTDSIQLLKSKFGFKYNKKQITSLEVDILTTLNFNIRYPLSYGFLRRFARCTRTDMKTLTLARYILETSLMDYEMIDKLESQMAAGSLLLAFNMMHLDGAWNEAATFYSGYNEKDLQPTIDQLNDMIIKFSRRKTAIRRKYCHTEYMEVARIPPMDRNGSD